MNSVYKSTILPFLSLFTSLGTLLCCALPALLVTLGMGATLAGVVTVAPWITWISDYKSTVFIVAGIMLGLSATVQWRARFLPCPVDPLKARACTRLRLVNWCLLGFSALIYAAGFFFAFLAADLLY